jgi:hypothetical protein
MLWSNGAAAAAECQDHLYSPPASFLFTVPFRIISIIIHHSPDVRE